MSYFLHQGPIDAHREDVQGLEGQYTMNLHGWCMKGLVNHSIG